MNLEKLFGLQEVFQDVTMKYVVEMTGIPRNLLTPPELMELSSMILVNRAVDLRYSKGLRYILIEDEDIDVVRDLLGVRCNALTQLQRKEVDAKPNHEHMGVLEAAGYSIVDVYESNDSRFVDVLYQRVNSSTPYVYAVVAKYIG